jgi:hypothetical protein
MGTVISRDGTSIAFDRYGQGPPVVLVGEDLDALIADAGGSASVFGMSSGAALALDAAAGGTAITRLALYEAPFIMDDSRAPFPADYLPRLNTLLGQGRRGDAVRLWLRLVGVPGPVVALMHCMPAWRKFKAVAHTLPYDAAALGDTMGGAPLPAGRWNEIALPVLAAVGSPRCSPSSSPDDDSDPVADRVDAYGRWLAGWSAIGSPHSPLPVTVRPGEPAWQALSGAQGGCPALQERHAEMASGGRHVLGYEQRLFQAPQRRHAVREIHEDLGLLSRIAGLPG